MKFISYNGGFPSLCHGELIVEIDGKEVKFGSGEGCDYPEFWTTGGRICSDRNWNMWAEHGPWDAWFGPETKFTEEEQQELLRLFRDNVPEGCCGGCI